jgi:outer membrane protein assembly factor BamB
MRRTLILMLPLVLASLDAQQAGRVSPQDYTQWRGQQRDGSASAFKAPKAWPENLTQKWKVEVGAGYATPLVVGNRVYTITRQGGDEVMMALDAATGKTVWETKYPAPYKMSPATKAHGEGPKATPLYYNGKLYTLGISGIVSAFDATNGKLLWQKPAPPKDPLYGTAMSPVADRGLVIVHVGGHDQGALTAFDANTGAVKWEWPGDGPAYGSPVIASIDGTPHVITVTQKKIVGVDLPTGQLLWERPLAARASTNSLTPIVHDGVVIISAQDAGTQAFRPMKRGGQWGTDVLWENTDVEMKLSNPVLVGDLIYGFTWKNSGQFFAQDVKSGNVVWRGKEREAGHSSLVKAGNVLFWLNDDGKLTVGTAGPQGFTPAKTYTVAESATWAQPTVSGNRIFIKDVNALALWTIE